MKEFMFSFLDENYLFIFVFFFVLLLKYWWGFLGFGEDCSDFVWIFDYLDGGIDCVERLRRKRMSFIGIVLYFFL